MERMPACLSPRRSTIQSISNLALFCPLFFAYLLDILALQLGEESVKTLIISLDSDGFENLLDVLCGRRGVTAEGEEKVGCEVLHFDCCKEEMSVQLSTAFLLNDDAQQSRG
jgi:hypothetical protein